MKTAIKEKLINLVSISNSDPIIQQSIGLKNIDLIKYIPKEEIKLFIEGESPIITFDLYKMQSQLETELKKANNVNDFIDIASKFNCVVSNYRMELLTNNFLDNKQKTISNLIEQINSFSKKLLTLQKIAKNYYDDTNVWPLYIATKFLEGRTISFKFFKSPLYLFRVEVKIEGQKLLLIKSQDDLVLNEKLLVYLKKEYKDNTTNISELFSLSNYEEIITSIEKITKNHLDRSSENEFVEFQDNDWNNPSIDSEKLKIYDNCILGIYEPDGGQLKEDLKWMIENEKDPFDVKDEKDKSVEFYKEKVIKEQSVIEIGNSLNVYQKYAIASALNQNTLIYGPPGTGKSETIANLIFNILLKGKTSLLVSEKSAALNVLAERINSLSKFALFIFDLKNKEAFYNKLNELNQLLGTQWYREKIKGSKNAKIDPIKFSREESMFFKNYEDWYFELLTIVKEYWNIEDYSDGLYKLDYSNYMKIKNNLGNQIINEWLSSVENKKTLYEEIKLICNEYNFLKIEDLFFSYKKFIKFIKKFDLSKWTHSEISSNLEKIIKKIEQNTHLVETYLCFEKKFKKLFEEYDLFLDKYSYDESTYDEIFFNKTNKEKKIFINQTIKFLEFYENVIKKDYMLNNKSKEELLNLSVEYQNYYEKHKKLLEKEEMLEFLIENKDKIQQFLFTYNNLPQEAKKIYFAEFISNSILLPTNSLEESSTLSMREISTINKNLELTLDLFNDFVKNTEVYGKERFGEIINYKEFLNINEEFLYELVKVKDIFDQDTQDIYKEKSWLFFPFIKILYMEGLVVFDLSKIEPIMNKITTFISNEQFNDLKIVLFWQKIIKMNPIFTETKGRFLQDIISQLRKESERSSQIVEEITFKKYIQNLRNYLSKISQEEKDEVATVFKLASSNNNLPPPAKFIKHFYKALRKLFPIWVARPDNVASIIPLNENEFDYGIFDEASQMTLERAYPLVYRCAKKIVAGDDKQLKPTSFFQNKVADTEFDIDDFDRADSLLERAKTSWWNEYHLRNHYRSWSKTLIEFSNKYIYNNNLEIASRSDYLQNAIEVYNVNGIWESENKIEALKVIELIEQNWNKFKKILIITFNAKQALLIENFIIEKYNTFNNELKTKIDNNEIVINNLENVQGNEGDLVILSVAYGKNKEGILRSNFGPLNSNGGLNRLNVAVTRAKQKMIVVKSMMGNEIKIANQNNENALVFKKFIEYIDYISDQNLENQQNNFDNQVQNEFKSEIIKQIYGEIMMKLPSKYQILVDLNIGTKNIDLAIINKSKKEVVKAIILEKWKENRSFQLMIEDIDRQYFLEQRGYSTFRIKEFEWYIDKDKIVSKIFESLDPSKQNNKIDYVLSK